MSSQPRPEPERCSDRQVRAGHFADSDASESDELDDETAAAINRAEEQLDRGEGIELHQFVAEMRKKGFL